MKNRKIYVPANPGNASDRGCVENQPQRLRHANPMKCS